MKKVLIVVSALALLAGCDPNAPTYGGTYYAPAHSCSGGADCGGRR
ncbi:hypothetical protein [Shimia sp. SDUM112013]